MIECVIREGNNSGNWSQLTKTNNHECPLCMRLKLQACNLWDTIGFDDTEYDDDCSAST